MAEDFLPTAREAETQVQARGVEGSCLPSGHVVVANEAGHVLGDGPAGSLYRGLHRARGRDLGGWGMGMGAMGRTKCLELGFDLKAPESYDTTAFV